METELYKQNPWWEGKFEDNSISRQKYLAKLIQNLDNKEILFLTGLRRVGKTTIIKQFIAKLLDKKIVPNDILYVSLDSFNLAEFSISEIVKKYREIHKKSVREKIYLFFDEVVEKDNFEQELKSLYDSENVKIICSSSKATLMMDKRAYLTGRTKTIEVMPLTFQEFLFFKKIEIGKADRAILESYFKDYLKIGGIPYYVLTEDREYLNELVQNVIYKDIIARYKITNEKAIKELFNLLCERVGKITSYNKIANILGISVDSVKRYVGYFEKSYLFYVVDRYSKSLSERITSPKKIYIGDVGVKNMITGFRDLGASYENLVFLRIKDKEPFYYRENQIEIDFIGRDFLIEAKYDKDMQDKQKEIFDMIKRKRKILADGVDFFVGDS